MLNKAICEKCIKETCKDASWNDRDEEDWKIYRLTCPFNDFAKRIYTYKIPPEHCPYLLE